MGDRKVLLVRGYASVAGRRGVGLQLSERKILLGVVDPAVRQRCSPRGHRVAVRPVDPVGSVQMPVWYGVLTGVWLAVAFLLSSYDLRRAARLKAGAATGLLASVICLLTPYVTPPLPSSRFILFVSLVAMIVSVTTGRAFYTTTRVAPALGRRALVVGAG